MASKQIIDLSMPVHAGMPVYPGDPLPQLELHPSQAGSPFRIRILRIGTHTGTHVDAPLHLLPEGDTIDRMPLQCFAGATFVLNFSDLPAGAEISIEALQRFQPEIRKHRRILIRTDWLKRSQEYSHDYSSYFTKSPVLGQEACHWLVENKIELVGADLASLNVKNERMLHDVFLKANVVLVENLLHLDRLKGPLVDFYAMPLNICGADGCPVRAFAME